MSTKQKILDALDATLDDLDEDRLLQILLDAYAQKKLRIASLEQQQAGIQLAAQRDMENFQEERHRMRSDPLHHLTGEYFFEHRRKALEWQRFVIRVTSDRIDMCERLKGYDFAARQLSREEFLK